MQIQNNTNEPANTNHMSLNDVINVIVSPEMQQQLVNIASKKAFTFSYASSIISIDDYIAEANLKLVEKAEQVSQKYNPSKGDIKSYLSLIASNAMIDLGRKMRGSAESHEAGSVYNPLSYHALPPAPNGLGFENMIEDEKTQTPDEIVSFEDFKDSVRDDLNPRNGEREVFDAIVDFSARKEIQEYLSMTKNKVHSRIRAIRSVIEDKIAG